ncbi:hypothetical protein GCM10009754_85500 [Amycolatopsis minnesotensis]|uniref:(2Fe-2S) ferredoxin n=1 Tax=Amycolatopsis minnesotensis TaxID=337894 RepID=A0ABN2SVD9_9PSEU
MAREIANSTWNPRSGGNYPGPPYDFLPVCEGEKSGWRPRRGAVLMVCGRCESSKDDAWVRRLRALMYAMLGREAVTVTVSGCVRSCPRGKVAVVLASPTRGCWEWAAPPESEACARYLVSMVSHPAVGITEGAESSLRSPGSPDRTARSAECR